MKPTNKNASPKPLKGLKILFADDEPTLQDLMRLEMPTFGHEITVCPDGATAIAALERNTYDCVVVDLDMPGINGLQVIARAREISPDTAALVLTGKKTVDSAIEAIRLETADYLTKPCELEELDRRLREISTKRAMLRKVRALEKRLDRLEGAPKLVGTGPRIEQVRQLISKVAPTDSTVLILGETGTGKELVARAVHQQSARASAPFVAINCGALPENLIESELFGHRKGAFTGADEHRVGLFEVADGGTIFLDEIGELPKAMQAKLLRVLETGDIRRVGENTALNVNVRVVCATHRNLEEMVDNGDFREDLMFRINTFEIHLPSLRERMADIPELALHLYRRFRPNTKPGDVVFTPEALELLQAHSWPGNVRELANVVEHATILCERPPITAEHLPRRFSQRTLRPARGRGSLGAMTLQELEQRAILESLDRHNGNKPAVAEELGISLKTLYNKLGQTAQLEKSA